MFATVATAAPARSDAAQVALRPAKLYALFIATSVPVPIAIPTSARASARGVVDAVTGHRHAPPRACSRGNEGACRQA